MSTVFDDMAGLMANDLETTHKMAAEEVKASPFLDFLAQLLQTLLPMLIGCLPKAATAEQVHAAMQNLSLIQRSRMLFSIRRQLATNESVNRYAMPVHQATLKMLKTVTVEQTQQAMDTSDMMSV